MGEYQQIAVVTNLASLKNVFTNIQLQSGDRVRLKIDVISPFGYLFNLAGAELAFSPLMPDHMNLVDVWGEGNSGYIEMEATSPPLAAVLGFIADNWLGVAIAGVVLGTILIAISVSIKIGQADPNFTVGMVAAAAVAVGAIFIPSEKNSGGSS
jgi:hypothetical protein